MQRPRSRPRCESRPAPRSHRQPPDRAACLQRAIPKAPRPIETPPRPVRAATSAALLGEGNAGRRRRYRFVAWECEAGNVGAPLREIARPNQLVGLGSRDLALGPRKAELLPDVLGMLAHRHE